MSSLRNLKTHIAHCLPAVSLVTLRCNTDVQYTFARLCLINTYIYLNKLLPQAMSGTGDYNFCNSNYRFYGDRWLLSLSIKHMTCKRDRLTEKTPYDIAEVRLLVALFILSIGKCAGKIKLPPPPPQRKKPTKPWNVAGMSLLTSDLY